MSTRVLSIFFVISLSAICGQSHVGAARWTQDPIVTSRQIEELPEVSERPRLTFQKALRITEEYCRGKKIDLKAYFLVEGRLTPGDKNQGIRWYFRWLNDEVSVPDLEIVVSLNGKAARLPANAK